MDQIRFVVLDSAAHINNCVNSSDNINNTDPLGFDQSCNKINHSHSTLVATFSPFGQEEGLPFPLYLPLHWKIVLAIILVISLVVGFKLRFVILSYLSSPESNIGPINNLIWIDQLCGLGYSVVLLVRIMTLLSTVPLDSIFGPSFGYSINLLSCVYNAATCIWSLFIAVYRVLFILVQKPVSKIIGFDIILNILLLYGSVETVVIGSIYNHIDDKGSIIKSSAHLSNSDLAIINDYRVY